MVITGQVEEVGINLLKHHPRNANQGNVEAIKRSLAVNGWYGSVIVNKRTNHILAGNHRVMAARELGWEVVPVQYVNVDEKQELRILMADNRTTRLGQDDETKIADILSELALTEDGLDGTGYSSADLDALIGDLANDETSLGASVNEKREAYLNNDVRQIVLYYAVAQYERIVAAFEQKMSELGMEDFAEVVAHYLGVEDGDTEDSEEESGDEELE
jgi:ParB-like chromosome segregation protein Spo0J